MACSVCLEVPRRRVKKGAEIKENRKGKSMNPLSRGGWPIAWSRRKRGHARQWGEKEGETRERQPVKMTRKADRESGLVKRNFTTVPISRAISIRENATDYASRISEEPTTTGAFSLVKPARFFIPPSRILNIRTFIHVFFFFFFTKRDWRYEA